jgi:flavin reductase (DIM6/NTAB) family NADH-FMN oxidoreductase RutF
MSIDTDAFRQVMRHWTTGIAIFAAQHEGVRHGMTISSFTSITLEPPLVLASIQKWTRTFNLADQSGSFGITILSNDQQDISERFAGRLGDDQDRFIGVDVTTLVTGAPLLVGGLAHLDCRVVKKVDLESHVLFIGEVLAAQELNTKSPLTYYNRAYRKLQE